MSDKLYTFHEPHITMVKGSEGETKYCCEHHEKKNIKKECENPCLLCKARKEHKDV